MINIDSTCLMLNHYDYDNLWCIAYEFNLKQNTQKCTVR